MLLQLGDVLVVDAERPLAKFLVRVVEERQDGVWECEFLVDTVLAQLLNPSLDVGACGTGQVVVLHQHRAEIARQEGLSLSADLVGAILVPDPRRLILEVVREPLVEDVGGQRNVVVRRENHGSVRQAHVGAIGVTVPILGCTKSSGRVERNGACLRRHQLPSNRIQTFSTVVVPEPLLRGFTRSPAVRRRRMRAGRA